MNGALLGDSVIHILSPCEMRGAGLFFEDSKDSFGVKQAAMAQPGGPLELGALGGIV